MSETSSEPSTEATPEAPSDSPKTFSEDYVGGLRRESAGYRTKAKELEETVARLTEERDSARTATPELEARATAAEQEAVRLRVALEKGLSLDLVARLRGTTAEELAADADELMRLVAPAKPEPLHNYGGGSTEQPAQKPDLNAALRALARR